MRRFAFVFALLVLLTPAARAQAVVNGVPLGATIKLTDSARLATPITLAWQPGYWFLFPDVTTGIPIPVDWIGGFWQGDDPSGATYRVEPYDTGGGLSWTVGVEFASPAGVRARHYGVWRTIVSRTGAMPVVFRDRSPWQVPNAEIALTP